MADRERAKCGSVTRERAGDGQKQETQVSPLSDLYAAAPDMPRMPILPLAF